MQKVPLDPLQVKTLDRLLSSYEKKGMPKEGAVSVRPSSINAKYNDAFGDVRDDDWFESRMFMLEKEGVITCSKDGNRIRNIRLVLENAQKAAEMISKKLSMPEDGTLLIERDDLAGDIDKTYYREHPAIYVKERPLVLQLSAFFKERRNLLGSYDPVNVRSFQIWQREKLISTGKGITVLWHCGLDLKDMNMYETHEPIPAIVLHRNTPQNILIVENSATFAILMKMIGEKQFSILGRTFGTALYGGGGRIVDQVRAFRVAVEPYVLHPDNNLYYFGDLDRKGISLFLGVRRELGELGIPIQPLTEAYVTMAKQMDWYLENTDCVPEQMKEGQQRSAIEGFDVYFSNEEWDLIQKHLDNNVLIPQEILTQAMLTCED